MSTTSGIEDGTRRGLRKINGLHTSAGTRGAGAYIGCEAALVGTFGLVPYQALHPLPRCQTRQTSEPWSTTSYLRLKWGSKRLLHYRILLSCQRLFRYTLRNLVRKHACRRFCRKLDIDLKFHQS